MNKEYQHDFPLDFRRANPQPGTEIWMRVEQHRDIYAVAQDEDEVRDTFRGYPYLPSFNDREVGRAVGYYYPFMSKIVLWECKTIDPYRSDPPTQDELLRVLWVNWERYLIRNCESVREITTPAASPYTGERSLLWQDFLEQRGYVPHTRMSWRKVLSPDT